MFFHYLKFFLSPIFTLAIGLGVYVGGTTGLLIVLGVEAFIVFGEVFFGDDVSKPKYKYIDIFRQ